ncbi:hypothetical protein C6N34_002315 [Cylindrospermopsis raciborskii Cr2010]|uniref:hypothetical protein n=1 Tax=Cylindrospermopsis raciborskii TaxID=77022 RepID=UPI0011C06684|nr:hypothetical protein [Cylindrospermopsis raciborskii]UJL34087.1 hypothetical protein C6N34_002315 [Cylindrospermopsis raciborskii Cr2010]
MLGLPSNKCGTHALRRDRLIYDVSKSMLNSDGKRFLSKDKSVISMLLGYLPGDRLWESSLLPSQWKILNMRTGDRFALPTGSRI